MKFMAIGTHPPVTTDALRADNDGVRANVEFIQARVADGTYDGAFIMVGGGRLIIVNAETEEAALSSLTTPPDHVERQWKITQLLDFDEVMAAYLKG